MYRPNACAHRPDAGDYSVSVEFLNEVHTTIDVTHHHAEEAGGGGLGVRYRGERDGRKEGEGVCVGGGGGGGGGGVEKEEGGNGETPSLSYLTEQFRER